MLRPAFLNKESDSDCTICLYCRFFPVQATYLTSCFMIVNLASLVSTFVTMQAKVRVLVDSVGLNQQISPVAWMQQLVRLFVQGSFALAEASLIRSEAIWARH